VTTSRSRLAWHGILLAIDLVLLLSTLIHLGGELRFLVGLVFTLVIPGWCLMSYVRVASPALAWSLVVGTSLAILLLASQLALSAHYWHPRAQTELLELLCALCLLDHLRRDRPARSA